MVAATTEYHKYRHTLSRHDARPILRERSKRSIAAKRATVRQPARCAGDAHRDRTLRSSSAVISTLAAGGRSVPLSHARPTRTRGLRSLRSEEHTSELQSLMRISYAVFCLKKNIKEETNTDNT